MRRSGRILIIGILKKLFARFSLTRLPCTITLEGDRQQIHFRVDIDFTSRRVSHPRQREDTASHARTAIVLPCSNMKLSCKYVVAWNNSCRLVRAAFLFLVVFRHRRCRVRGVSIGWSAV